MVAAPIQIWKRLAERGELGLGAQEPDKPRGRRLCRDLTDLRLPPTPLDKPLDVLIVDT
jgi:hypothetical protein